MRGFVGYLCGGLLGIVAGLSQAQTQLPKVDEPEIPIFSISAADRSPSDIGSELGRLVKERFPDLEQRYDAYLHEAMGQAQFAELLEKQVLPSLNSLDLPFQQEVVAMVKTWQLVAEDQLGDGQLSVHEAWVLQFLPELQTDNTASGFAVLGNISTVSGPIVGRNWAQFSNEKLRSLAAITLYHYEYETVVNLGFAGTISVFSGFNHQGLFAGYVAAPVNYSTHVDEVSMAASHWAIVQLRTVLQQAKSVREAVALLSDQSYRSSHNVWLADGKTVQVLEQPIGAQSRVREVNSPLRTELLWDKPDQMAVVNCFGLQENPANCYDSYNVLRWQRFRELAHFSDKQPASPHDIIKIMLDRQQQEQAIFETRTMQAMVFVPMSRDLYLYTVPTTGNPDEVVMRPIALPLPNVSQLSGLTIVFGFGGMFVIWMLGFVYLDRRLLRKLDMQRNLG